MTDEQHDPDEAVNRLDDLAQRIFATPKPPEPSKPDVAAEPEVPGTPECKEPRPNAL